MEDRFSLPELPYIPQLYLKVLFSPLKSSTHISSSMKYKKAKKLLRKSPKHSGKTVQISPRINRDQYESIQFPKWDW